MNEVECQYVYIYWTKKYTPHATISMILLCYISYKEISQLKYIP